MIDYPSFRVDTDHEETPIDGETWCAVCGWVDYLNPNSTAARLYHGDSFGITLTLEEHEMLEETIV